jgi:hypothetical protein
MLKPAECNYDIYDMELMAIIQALDKWRPECDSAAYLLQWSTDDKNIEHFMRKKLLNRREACWSEILTCFDYQTVHMPGESNGQPDASTRRPVTLPEGRDKRITHMEQVVLKPQNLAEQLRLLADGPPAQGCTYMMDLYSEADAAGPLPRKVLNVMQVNGSLKEITEAECTEQDGRIQYRGKCYGPEDDQLRLRLKYDHHYTTLTEHPARAKRFDHVDRQNYWREMQKQVD